MKKEERIAGIIILAIIAIVSFVFVIKEARLVATPTHFEEDSVEIIEADTTYKISGSRLMTIEDSILLFEHVSDYE